MFPDLLTTLRLDPFDVILSTNCPEDHVFAIDVSSLWVGVGGVEFSVSDAATIVPLNTNEPDPRMGSDVAGYLPFISTHLN